MFVLSHAVYIDIRHYKIHIAGQYCFKTIHLHIKTTLLYFAREKWTFPVQISLSAC